MASKTKKIRIIRKRKHKPNRTNLKADQKRILKNVEILRSLEAESS